MTSKRFTIALLSIFLSVIAWAADKDLEKDITMVSYEQSHIDAFGSLALKNNTDTEIKNIQFIITYLDMSDLELDYKEFSLNTSIAPGKTKKINIPAYEMIRRYYYYKTKDEYGEHAFKIKFQLKDYNVDDGEEEIVESTYNKPLSKKYQSPSEDNVDYTLEIVLGICLILIAISISIGLYILVALMAQKRHRSVIAWVLLSILATPILMIIILLVIGQNEDYNAQSYTEE